MQKNKPALIVLVVICAIFLTGCFGTTEVVRDTRYIYEQVPEELTEEVDEVSLIDREEYMEMTLPERESYLIGIVMQASSTIKTANSRFKEIRQLEGRQIQDSQNDEGEVTGDEGQ